MNRLYLSVATVLLLTLTGSVPGSQGQSVDLTLLPGTSGALVVDAVVDKIHSHCLFNDDRMFLRRLAYVESLDGNDPKTYRQGYHGGIWQVEESMLTATQGCANIIRRECEVISQEFGIDWHKVTWSQLRVPLYSALAAALYLQQRLANTHVIPGDLAGQADIWAHYYHLNFPTGTYITLAAQATQYVCNGQLDLAFLVDSSGSIMVNDYHHQLDFVANVVQALPVDSGTVRVAAVNFGSRANVTFTFDTYTSEADIISHIKSMPKDNGGTNTDSALNLTRTVVFNPQHGARPNARKVAILLTDGESYDTNATIRQAQLLRKDGVVVFAIGVGYINLQELLSVASNPACTHVYVLNNYANIDSILYEIQKSSCEEAIRTNCSIADVYVSYTNPNPNPVIYNHKLTASDGHPAILTMEQQVGGLPVYITVVGTRLPASSSALAQCSDFTYQINFETLPAVDIVCREKSTYRDCHPEDFIGSVFEHLLCPSQSRPVSNPCGSSSVMIHPHPYDVHYFIKCDLLGKMYITLCPDNNIFNSATLACGYENHEVGGGVQLPDGYNNPCSPDAIKNGLYFFAYANDKHKFIQCDVWGGAWLKNCQTHHVWNDQAHTCVPDTLHEFDKTTLAPFEITNPCTPQALNAGMLFFPHPCDHTKYIHCDIAGNYYIQACPASLFFDPSTFVCVPHDPQSPNPDCH